MALIRDHQPIKVEHAQGGEGHILRDVLLTDELLHGVCSFCACITLEPGCTIGEHRHDDDSEMYFITEGNGIYTDNGEEYPVQPGDVLFCYPGGSHAMANTGDSTLRFVAVMQKA